MAECWLTTGFVLLSSWSVGLVLAAHLLHPAEREPASRRWAAMTAMSRDGPVRWIRPAALAVALVATALVAVLLHTPWLPGEGTPPYLIVGAIALVPFAVAACGWGLSQLQGLGGTAEERWWAGAAVQAGVLGVAAAGAGILLLGHPPWDSPAVLTSIAGTGSMTGALSLLVLCPELLTGEDGGEAGVRLQALVGAGILLVALSLAEVAWGWFRLGAFRPPCGPLLVWATGSLAVPALFSLILWRLFPSGFRQVRLLSVVSLVCILAGQYAALAVTLGHTPLVPPPGW